MKSSSKKDSARKILNEKGFREAITKSFGLVKCIEEFEGLSGLTLSSAKIDKEGAALTYDALASQEIYPGVVESLQGLSTFPRGTDAKDILAKPGTGDEYIKLYLKNQTERLNITLNVHNPDYSGKI